MALRVSVKSAIDMGVSIAMLVASLMLIRVALASRHDQIPTQTRVPDLSVPEEPMRFGDGFTVGKPSARIVILEFTDFQCPYCARAARDTIPGLLSGAVKRGDAALEIHHLPLEIHPLARKAAEFATCAGMQGKFMEMHDSLFADPRLGTLNEVISRVHGLEGMDPAAVDECVGSGRAFPQLERDLSDARRLKLSATPSFLVGRRLGDGRVKLTSRLVGAVPAASIERLVADAMNTR